MDLSLDFTKDTVLPKEFNFFNPTSSCKDKEKQICWDVNPLPSLPFNSWNAMKNAFADQLAVFPAEQLLEYILEPQVHVPNTTANHAPVASTTVNPISISTTQAVSQITPPTAIPQNNLSNIELNFLIQQISELKDNNKSLEGKLGSVTCELIDLKSKQAQMSVQNTSSSNSWHSFEATSNNNDIALSVWRTTSEGNVLAECNDKFMELVGYPTSVLHNNFLFSRLVYGISVDLNPKEWPKKTKIATSTGIKDVFVTVTAIPASSKCIMQITETL